MSIGLTIYSTIALSISSLIELTLTASIVIFRISSNDLSFSNYFNNTLVIKEGNFQ
jgi:hypothetical protein